METNKPGTSSNSSVEVASKGVSTIKPGISLTKKESVAIHIDESGANTTASENHVNDSTSTASGTEYYRLTSASRSKFAGKSPSVYEFISVHK